MYVKWNSSPPTIFCLNTDGAFTQGKSRASFGGVFRDYKGNWIMGYAGHSPSTSVINIELMALLRGLQMALAYHLTLLQIHMDAHEVINMINNNNSLNSAILFECRFLIHQLNSPPLSHTYREQNIVADKLAHFGMELEGTPITFFADPPHFSSLHIAGPFE